MTHAHNLLALDLGAESGRGILGTLHDGRITLDVLHRFPNGPTKVGNKLYWDPLRLFGEMKHALAQAADRGPLASLGVDTWGVDFALLGDDGEMLTNPRHYRDPHTEAIFDSVLSGTGAGPLAPLSPALQAICGDRRNDGRGRGEGGEGPAWPTRCRFELL